MTPSRHTIAAGIAVLGLALSAGPALASGGSGSGGGGTGGGGTGGGGGGGGGGTTTLAAPPVGAPWTLCPEYATGGPGIQPDGSILFANEVGGIGCLIARTSGGLLSIYEVRTGTGWVSTLKSSDPQKLDVQWTWPATGTKHEITVQPGKTAIR